MQHGTVTGRCNTFSRNGPDLGCEANIEDGTVPSSMLQASHRKSAFVAWKMELIATEKEIILKIEGNKGAFSLAITYVRSNMR
jgi:hypothetical protein